MTSQQLASPRADRAARTLVTRRRQIASSWLVAAIVLLAFALRVVHLDFQSLWRDEVDAIRFATRPLPELLSTFGKPGENGPLFFLLLRPWLQWFGQSEFALRFFSVLWGVLSVPLTWLVARRLLRVFAAATGLPTGVGWIAGLAALLSASSPYLVWYSQEGKMYALVTALALGSLLALLWALTPGAVNTRLRWLMYIVLTSLGFYLHVMLVLMLPVHAAIFILAPARMRQHWRGALTAVACFTLPYLPLVWWQWRLFTSPTFSPGFDFVPLPRELAILLAAFGRGMRAAPPIGLVSVWIFLLLAAFVLAYLQPRRSWRRSVVFLGVWLIAPPLLLFLITLRVPLFNDRYLIYIGPAFYLLSAVGVYLVGQRSRALAIAALVLALMLNLIGVWGQAVTPIKSDFRAAAALVQARRDPTDVLIFLHPYSRFTYAYYAGWDYAWREAPYTNDRQRVSADGVGATLSRLLQGVTHVWLIESEAETWDRRGFNRQWLASHGQITAEAALNGVRVTRWALR